MLSPIQIKRPDVAADIRALASLTGASITDAVGSAVAAQLAIERVKASAELSRRMAESARVLEELRSLPVAGPAISDSDLYDSGGLPR